MYPIIEAVFDVADVLVVNVGLFFCGGSQAHHGVGNILYEKSDRPHRINNRSNSGLQRGRQIVPVLVLDELWQRLDDRERVVVPPVRDLVNDSFN
jgi:hypothetical protein